MGRLGCNEALCRLADTNTGMFLNFSAWCSIGWSHHAFLRCPSSPLTRSDWILTLRNQLMAAAVTGAVVISAALFGASGASAAPHRSSTLVATDVASYAGIAAVTNDRYGNTCVGDFNGDGITDLILGNHLIAPWDVDLGNADGTFTTIQRLPTSDRHGCAVGDFNNDGRLDFYITIGADKGTATNKSNELWLQNASGTFDLAATGSWGAGDPTGRGRAVDAFDANGDGLIDLYVGNGYPVQQPSSNKLFLNQGGLFVRDTAAFPIPGSGGLCAADGDANGDGLPDLFACAGKNHLWVGSGNGTYTDRAAAWGMQGETSSWSVWGDLNGDGVPDLVTVGSTQMNVYYGGDGRLTKGFSYPLTQGRRAAIADFDLDGRPDIYITQGRQLKATPQNVPDVLLLNQGANIFTPFTGLPQATKGGGNDVRVIPNYNGRPALVVTNGGDGAQTFRGPRQLIEFTG